jgi:mono/diheme cytochrome c family protein
MKTHCLLLLCVVSGACSDNSPSTGVDLGPPDLASPAPDLLIPPDLADPQLSARAQRGLMLSPVAIDTSTMPYAQKELVGTGAYWVVAINCGNCHGSTQATFLSGGRMFGTMTNPVYARNLTPHATTGMKLSQAEFIEAMRTGKDFVDSSLLQSMPYTTYRWMTNYDLQAIYAYLQAIPAVNNQTLPDMKATPGTPTPSPTTYSDGLVARQLPDDSTVDPLGELRGQALQVLNDPPNFGLFSDASKRAFGRGAYLVTQLGCNGCHTNPAIVAGKPNANLFLSGGRVFATAMAMQATLGTVRVMSTNLTGQQNGLQMTMNQFVQTLTTFKHADETNMRALGAPMPDYKNLVDEDMAALYTYLTAVPRRTGAADKATQEYARYCTADANCNLAAGETCSLTSNECVGKACTVDANCDACQTCGAGLICLAPIAGSACLTSGI